MVTGPVAFRTCNESRRALSEPEIFQVNRESTLRAYMGARLRRSFLFVGMTSLHSVLSILLYADRLLRSPLYVACLRTCRVVRLV